MARLRHLMRAFYERLGRDGRAAVGVGSSLVCLMAMFQYKFNETVYISENPADVSAINKLYAIRALFGRTRSRLTGLLMNKHIPPSLRLSVYPVVGWLWGSDLDEARYPLDSYKCIGHLFARTLKHGSREIADISESSLVSPVDGKVCKIGNVNGARIEQVKGSSFNVESFLGSSPKATAARPLRYIVLYLSPDKYHHFHAPCDFQVKTRKHFSGEVLPVFSSFLSRMNDVFSVNERVVYSGSWKGGALYYAAVAAYNVGNIRLAHDKEFRSNNMRAQMFYLGGDIDVDWMEQKGNALALTKGEHMGEFRLGSTVVLVFECPDGFDWSVSEGESVKVGERLGSAEHPLRPPAPLYIGYSRDLSCLDSQLAKKPHNY